MPGARNTQKTVPVKKMTSGQKTDLSIGIAAGVGAPLLYVGQKRLRTFLRQAPQRTGVQLWKLIRQARRLPQMTASELKELNKKIDVTYNQYQRKMTASNRSSKMMSYDDFKEFYLENIRKNNPVSRSAARELDKKLVQLGYVPEKLGGRQSSRVRFYNYLRNYNPEKRNYVLTRDQTGRKKVKLSGIQPETRRAGIYDIKGVIKDPATHQFDFQSLKGEDRKLAYLTQNARLDPIFAEAENRIGKKMAYYRRQGIKNVKGFPISEESVTREVLEDMGLWNSSKFGDKSSLDSILRLRQPSVGRAATLRSWGQGKFHGGKLSWYDRWNPDLTKLRKSTKEFQQFISDFDVTTRKKLMQKFNQAISAGPRGNRTSAEKQGEIRALIETVEALKKKLLK